MLKVTVKIEALDDKPIPPRTNAVHFTWALTEPLWGALPWWDNSTLSGVSTRGGVQAHEPAAAPPCAGVRAETVSTQVGGFLI